MRSILAPQSRAVQAACGLLIVLALLATILRVVRQYHQGGTYSAETGGMADYHNGIYYPALSMREGISPYGVEFAEKYPVARPTPPFSPFAIASHIPLTYLALPVSDVVYFACIVLSLFLIAWIVLSELDRKGNAVWLLPLTLALIVSRSGHVTLLNGYHTTELVLGTLVALRYAESRPWLAAVGILLASGKPTYAIPLGIVLLARGNWRALSFGVGLSIIAAAVPAAWLASHIGWSGLLESIKQGQSLHMADPREYPVNTWTRIDIAAIVAKWFGANPSELIQLIAMVPIAVLPAITLWRLRRFGDSSGITTLSGAIAIVTMLVMLYHHVYDALVLAAPIVAVLLSNRPEWSSRPKLTRIGVAILLSCCWWNYFSSEIVLNRMPDWWWLKQGFASLNAVSLVIALGWLLAIAWKRLKGSNQHSESASIESLPAIG